MGRRVGLPREFVGVEPGAFYPVSRPVPAEFQGRGRWASGPLHTFVDDYRQEFVWRRPQEGLLMALAAGVCTAPDFTVWLDEPPEWRAFQAWRSAVVAGYWQANGVDVLPVVSFGSGCERFVRPGSTWAVRAPGRGSDAARWADRLQGFVELAQVGRLIVFGVTGAARLVFWGECCGVPVEVRALCVRGGAAEREAA